MRIVVEPDLDFLLIIYWTKYDLLAVTQSQSSDRLETSTKALVTKLIDQQDIWESSFHLQTDLAETLHHDTRQIIIANNEHIRDQTKSSMTAIHTKIEQQHNEIRQIFGAQQAENRLLHDTTTIVVSQAIGDAESAIISTITAEGSSNRSEHEALRQEVLALKKSLEELVQQIKIRDNELKLYLSAFDQTRNIIKRKSLAERSNAVSITLMALRIVHQALLVKVSASVLHNH